MTVMPYCTNSSGLNASTFCRKLIHDHQTSAMDGEEQAAISGNLGAMPRNKLYAAVDQWLPFLALRYRQARDAWWYQRPHSYMTIFGFTLHGDQDLDTSRAESHEVAVFIEELSACDVVVDVGANVGLFTCLSVQAGKRTVALEPHPGNLKLLYRTLLDNGFVNVEVFPLALSDAPGILPLLGGGQAATLTPGWCGIQSTYTTNVSTNTLDNLMASRFPGERLLIKIDVEGNEFNVLKGSVALLARDPAPVWILEHGLTQNFQGLNPHFQDIFDVFWRAGYSAFVVGEVGERVTPEDVSRWIDAGQVPSGYLNYVFRPSSDRIS